MRDKSPTFSTLGYFSAFERHIAAQCQRPLHYGPAIDCRGDLDLNEIIQTTRDIRFDPDNFARFGGSRDLHVAHRGQFKIGQWCKLRVALGHDAGQLSSGFDE